MDDQNCQKIHYKQISQKARAFTLKTRKYFRKLLFYYNYKFYYNLYKSNEAFFVLSLMITA